MAANTVADFLPVIIVFTMSYNISKKSFCYFVPRLLWLALATYVSVWIALHNGDVFFDALPFVQ